MKESDCSKNKYSQFVYTWRLFVLLSLLIILQLFCSKNSTIPSGEITSDGKILKLLFQSSAIIVDDCKQHEAASDTYGEKCKKYHVHLKAAKTLFTKMNFDEFADQESLLISIDTIYRDRVDDKNIAIVFLEIVPTRFDCRNCAPSIGCATFLESEDKKTYYLKSYQEHLLNYGNYGSITKDYSILKIGAYKIALKFKQGSMGQGLVEEETVVFVNDTTWNFNNAFSYTTYSSNEGVCDTVNVPCEIMDCKVSVSKYMDKQTADLLVNCKKTVNGAVTDKSVDTFHFNGNTYSK